MRRSRQRRGNTDQRNTPSGTVSGGLGMTIVRVSSRSGMVRAGEFGSEKAGCTREVDFVTDVEKPVQRGSAGYGQRHRCPFS